jgi:hypothetical protein
VLFWLSATLDLYSPTPLSDGIDNLLEDSHRIASQSLDLRRYVVARGADTLGKFHNAPQRRCTA